MGATKIQWTDETLNPARGCEAVSPGCLNCYAARNATRFAKEGEIFAGLARMKKQPDDQHGRKRPSLAVWTGKVTLIPGALRKALGWSPKKRKRVFVGSVTDMFHREVPFEFLAALFGVMAATPWVTYQIVTKRPERMVEFFEWLSDRDDDLRVSAHRFALELLHDDRAEAARHGALPMKELPGFLVRRLAAGKSAPWPLPNVHLLTSAENQETFDQRVPHLLACPAVVHGISAEPLLGPIDMALDRWVRIPHTVRADTFPGVRLPGDDICVDPGIYKAESNSLGALSIPTPQGSLGIKPTEFERLSLRWIISGGESGPGARACAIEWLRGIGQQCRQQHVPMFVKQLGTRPTIDGYDRSLGDHHHVLAAIRSKKGGELDDMPTDLRVREFPR